MKSTIEPVSKIANMQAAILFLGIFISAISFAYDGVFYCTYQNDECVDYSNPVEVEETEMKSLVERVGGLKTNFIGFIDNDGTTLQFFVDAVNLIWVEIPVPSEKGSWGAQINQSEMQNIVKHLDAPYIDYKTKLNLTFQAW